MVRGAQMSSDYRGPRGRGRPPRTTNSKVAAAALRLFRQQGFEATTADEIAAGAGISRSTFFRYFGSKSEILWHCQAEQVTALEERLHRLGPAPDPFAVVANAVVDVTRDVGVEECDAARDYQALIADRPDLDSVGPVWSARRVGAIRDYIARELGQDPYGAIPVTFAFAVDAAVRAAGIRFAHSSGEELHELVATSVAPIYAGFAGAVPAGARTAQDAE